MSKKRRPDEGKELIPLTDKLYTEFSVEMLEERLETDPLMLSGLFDEIVPFCVQCKSSDFDCPRTYCTTCFDHNDPCTCNSVDTDIECFK